MERNTLMPNIQNRSSHKIISIDKRKIFVTVRQLFP